MQVEAVHGTTTASAPNRCTSCSASVDLPRPRAPQTPSTTRPSPTWRVRGGRGRRRRRGREAASTAGAHEHSTATGNRLVSSADPRLALPGDLFPHEVARCAPNYAGAPVILRCRRCSCGPCVTTRPTPRCRATGCSSAPATSAGSAPGIYSWLPLGLAVLAQRRADRARGDGRDRRAGGALPGAASRARSSRRAVAGPTTATAVPAAGPQGRRLPARPDARGAVHPAGEGRVLVLQGLPARAVPDPDEVPRRGASARRASCAGASSS